MSRRKSPGRGSGRLRRLSVPFDDDTADQIATRAQREGTSTAEQVRLLVEWGLEEDKEGKQDAAARSQNR
jgi:hypothetical protein